jgi:hypothetical protein
MGEADLSVNVWDPVFAVLGIVQVHENTPLLIDIGNDACSPSGLTRFNVKEDVPICAETLPVNWTVSPTP